MEPLPDEFELTVDETDPAPRAKPGAESPEQGLFVVFGLRDGRILELHVVAAKGIKIGGHSNALANSFFLYNRDGSIEHSGSLVMLDSAGNPVLE